jgi:outer membrane protein assembly factor BamD (BamD/ComL family)
VAWHRVLALFCSVLAAQVKPPAPAVEEPPEEDELLVREKKEYEFNPLQAQQEIKVGRFYMKRGSWKAAAGRFLEATLWDPTNAEAFHELGKAREKTGNKKGMREAWLKFLELAPEDKRAAEIKKKIAAERSAGRSPE